MTRLSVALAWLALAAAARADAPLCRADVSVEPPKAVVGQQVRYRVQIERRGDVSRVDWSVPPGFANARVELLPPEPGPRVTRDGVDYEMHEEVRAVFPERTGTLALPGATLRRELPHGAAQELRLPDARLEVQAPPEAGRPAGYAGLVGPLWLSLTVTPDRVALGSSLRVALMARGGGNLWALDAVPFASDAFADSDRFERQPELVFERGRDLIVRQHLAFDLVPRSPGRLIVPALAIPYYDPAAGVYRVATTQEVEVRVEEEDRTRALPPEAGARSAPPRALPGTGVSNAGRMAALGTVVALAAAATWWWRRRRADVGRAAQALARAAQARAAGDAAGELAAFARALRAALEPHVPGVAALSVEELLARPLEPPARAAGALLAAVERARYERGAPAPGPDQVERAVRALDAGSGSRVARMWLGALALCAALVTSAGVGTGCAGPSTSRDDPMTPARLESWLREQTVGLEDVDGQLRFVHDGVRMICLHDVHADRLRVVAAVTEESALTVANARILLQANFGQTLDARYAIKDGVLYAVYLHPLSTLDARQLKASLDQVANLVRNYGTTFSAVGR